MASHNAAETNKNNEKTSDDQSGQRQDNGGFGRPDSGTAADPAAVGGTEGAPDGAAIGAAEGATEVLRVYHLSRGYERLVEKLSGPGARAVVTGSYSDAVHVFDSGDAAVSSLAASSHLGAASGVERAASSGCWPRGRSTLGVFRIVASCVEWSY